MSNTTIQLGIIIPSYQHLYFVTATPVVHGPIIATYSILLDWQWEYYLTISMYKLLWTICLSAQNGRHCDSA